MCSGLDDNEVRGPGFSQAKIFSGGPLNWLILLHCR